MSHYLNGMSDKRLSHCSSWTGPNDTAADTGEWQCPWVFRITVGCSRRLRRSAWDQKVETFLRLHEHALHDLVTYDGANIRFCLNGTEVSSVANTGSLKTSTNPSQIGGDLSYNQFFQGTIDEVRVYSRALSATEIVTDMNTALGGSGSVDHFYSLARRGPYRLGLLDQACRRHARHQY